MSTRWVSPRLAARSLPSPRRACLPPASQPGSDMTGGEEDERGFFSEFPVAMPQPPLPVHNKKADKPHYLGHRDRLRNRFLEIGATTLADYELLELLLFRSIPRADTKG